MTKHCVREADAPRKNLVAAFAKMDRQLDAREAKGKKRKRAPIPFAVLRLRNIEKVMSDLYGSVLPEGDDGAMVDLEILIATVIAAGKPPMNFMRKWVPPWMSQDDAERFVARVNPDLAYLDADGIAKRMGVGFATKERPKTRTIGSYDVPKAERDKIYRQRYEANRKQAAAEKKPALSEREKAILKMVGVMAGMSDVANKAKRHPLFRGREDIARQVRRIVQKLEESGHCGSRLEPQHRGGTERFIWNEAISKAKETAAAQAHPENVRRGTPIFYRLKRPDKILRTYSEGDGSKFRRREVGSDRWSGRSGSRALRLRCGALPTTRTRTVNKHRSGTPTQMTAML
jgi:hypothetical protein